MMICGTMTSTAGFLSTTGKKRNALLPSVNSCCVPFDPATTICGGHYHILTPCQILPYNN